MQSILPINADTHEGAYLTNRLNELETDIGGHHHIRTILCSHPGEVLAIRLTTTAPAGLGMSVRLRRTRDATVTRDGATPRLRGRPQPHGVAFAADLARTTEGGHIGAAGDGIRISGAQAAVTNPARAPRGI